MSIVNGGKADNVRSLSEEKCAALSEQNGWPLAFAEGYIGGQTERRRGNQLSSYVMTGIDQYALGFRAGYFERRARTEELVARTASLLS